jgi:thiamine kinase-like enzyme
LNERLKKLCQQHHLGEPLLIKEIRGGLLHQLFQVQTSVGCYAIKCLQQDVQKELAHNLLAPHLIQKITADLIEKQVPAIKILYCDSAFIIMPWIAGQLLTVSEVTLQQCRIIGEVLSKIQQPIFEKHLPKPSWCGCNRAEWSELSQPLKTKQPVLYEFIQQELNFLIEASEQAADVMPELNQHLVFSHRDFDARNVIWQTPVDLVILDWEYAGLINPLLDLLIVALNWSDIQAGHIRMENYQAVMSAFFAHSKPIGLMNVQIIKGYLGYCLDWVIYNLKLAARSELFNEQIFMSVRAMHLVIDNQVNLI